MRPWVVKEKKISCIYNSLQLLIPQRICFRELLSAQNHKQGYSTTYCTFTDKIIPPVVFFPLQAHEFLLLITET